LKTIKRIVAVVLIAIAIASIIPAVTFGNNTEIVQANPKPPP